MRPAILLSFTTTLNCYYTKKTLKCSLDNCYSTKHHIIAPNNMYNFEIAHKLQTGVPYKHFCATNDNVWNEEKGRKIINQGERERREIMTEERMQLDKFPLPVTCFLKK